eukprot:3481165-Rhodomonas_salina.5
MVALHAPANAPNKLHSQTTPRPSTSPEHMQQGQAMLAVILDEGLWMNAGWLYAQLGGWVPVSEHASWSNGMAGWMRERMDARSDCSRGAGLDLFDVFMLALDRGPRRVPDQHLGHFSGLSQPATTR